MVTPEDIARAMAVHSTGDDDRVKTDAEDAVVLVTTEGDDAEPDSDPRGL
jgi:hypothetical protein